MIIVHIGNNNQIVDVSDIQFVIGGLQKAKCSFTDSLREMENIVSVTRTLESEDFIHAAAYYYVRSKITLSSVRSIHLALDSNKKLTAIHT